MISFDARHEYAADIGDQQVDREAPRLLDVMRQKIRARHYTLRTEKAYIQWVRRFIRFHQRQHPRILGSSITSSWKSSCRGWRRSYEPSAPNASPWCSRDTKHSRSSRSKPASCHTWRRSWNATAKAPSLERPRAFDVLYGISTNPNLDLLNANDRNTRAEIPAGYCAIDLLAEHMAAIVEPIKIGRLLRAIDGWFPAGWVSLREG